MTTSSVPWPPDGGDAPTESTIVDAAEYWSGDEWQWDSCALGDIILPGHVTVTGDVSRKLDVKSAPGSDGAKITDKGYEPAKITIKCVMWLAAHKDQLKAALKVLHPRKKGKSRDSYKIDHASTSLLGISYVYIEKISLPVPGSIKGTKEITFSCIEWTQDSKKNVTTSPNKAVSNTKTDVGYFSARGGYTPPPQTLQNNALAIARTREDELRRMQTVQPSDFMKGP
jgi:hypothetical protein